MYRYIHHKFTWVLCLHSSRLSEKYNYQIILLSLVFYKNLIMVLFNIIKADTENGEKEKKKLKDTLHYL